jgi:hypothetical protein
VDDPLLYFAAVRGPHTPCEDQAVGALTWCGAEGNRTPDLLDANETRYQLRYSPEVRGKFSRQSLATRRPPDGKAVRRQAAVLRRSDPRRRSPAPLRSDASLATPR